ncbi:MAG: hybrid sensor histidine kinase/response regulator [Pseudomonadota bacterium]
MRPQSNATSSRERELEQKIQKLEKINASLISRVERSMSLKGNAYSLFHSAIGLESQVRIRTVELKSAVTDLEKSNDELTDARDASEREIRVKTRFFTAVGHDLLQPLHAARLSVSALDATSDEAEQNRLANQIDHALLSIEELLKTILDLSKLEAGVLRPSVSAVPLAEIFRGLCLELEPIAASKKISIRWRPTSYTVSSDSLMLRRILQNLLANAVRYTEHGGISIAARRRGDLIRIEVWDTGPGIADDDRERIFEEFQRGANLEQKSGNGFGLGLAIVQRMAAALEHQVGLCSRVGHGTCFYIYAPFAEVVPIPPPTFSPQDVAATYGLNGAHVLIIDNDKTILEAMKTLMKKWGCSVTAIESLAAISELDLSEARSPQIVLADYHLDHGQDGVTAVKKLREKFGEDLPGMIITADHSTQTASKVESANCELLRKPVKPAELRALMAHLLM